MPVQVNGLSDVKAISAGVYHSLAVKKDGTVWDWGDNSLGQLDSATGDIHIPNQVNGLYEVITIAAGGYCSFAIGDSESYVEQ